MTRARTTHPRRPLLTLTWALTCATVVGCLGASDEPDSDWRSVDEPTCEARAQMDLAVALHQELERTLGPAALDRVAEVESSAELVAVVQDLARECPDCVVTRAVARMARPPAEQDLLERFVGLEILEVSQDWQAVQADAAGPAPGGLDDHGDSLTNFTNGIDDHGDSLTNITQAIDDHGDSLTADGGGGGGVGCRSPFAGLGLGGGTIGSCTDAGGGLPPEVLEVLTTASCP